MIFGDFFFSARNNEKKIFIKKNEKKEIYGADLEWATAQLYF